MASSAFGRRSLSRTGFDRYIQNVKQTMQVTVVQHDRQSSLDFDWDHQPHGSFIRGPTTEVSLLFDSTARRWTLRIYKKQTSFGHPVTYEIAFRKGMAPRPSGHRNGEHDPQRRTPNANLRVELRVTSLFSRAVIKRHFRFYFRSRRLSVLGAERVARPVALSAGANLNSRLDEPLGLLVARF